MTVDDLGVDAVARASVPADSAWWPSAGGALEERLAHLGAAGVLQADEQDRAHGACGQHDAWRPRVA